MLIATVTLDTYVAYQAATIHHGSKGYDQILAP